MSEAVKENETNRMIKFLFEGAPVRGAIVQMQEQWQEMIAHQNYPANVASLLGQFTAGALLLSSTIKFDGALVLQVKGSGPVSMIVVEVKNSMSVRAMAQIKENAEIKETQQLQELINQDNKGQCAIILDPYDRRPGVQPYQGIVPLAGATVAENLEGYMMQSEQLETKLWLEATAEKLGGLLVQKMPGTGGTAAEAADPDAWGRIVQLANTTKAQELLSLEAPELLHRLFWQEKLQIVNSANVEFACNCSREKTDSMLRSLGKKECDDILKAEGKIEVRCQFCNRTQTYTPEEVEALFIEPSSEAACEGADPKRPQ